MTASLLLFPPLAPPRTSDEDAQLGVPAVRDLGVGLEIEQAVVAALVAVRLTLEDVVLDHVAQLQRLLLVDLLGLRLGQVVGHLGRAYTEPPRTASICAARARRASSSSGAAS